jgi:OmpA-OmpF porin, OOP family
MLHDERMMHISIKGEIDASTGRMVMSARMMERYGCAAIAVVIGIGSLAVASGVAAESNLYLGAGYGVSRVDQSDFDDDDTAMKIFFGAKLNRYFGLEAAVNDYGDTNDNGYSSELRGYTLAAVGFLPLTEKFDLFAKGGRLWWRDEVSYLDAFDETLSGSENFYGAGVNFNFGDSFSLRLEIERYKVKLSDKEIGVALDRTYNVDVAGVGVIVNF